MLLSCANKRQKIAAYLEIAVTTAVKVAAAG
jgi:hypothetical protein